MVTKAFLLDPVKKGIPANSQLPKFLRLAKIRAGWDVVRPAELDRTVDGARWLSDLRSELEGADVIIGLGNFLAVRQSGTELESLLGLMRQKISSGCPALFEGCVSLVSREPPNIEGIDQKVDHWLRSARQIRGLFSSYGIHITTKRVFSSIHEYELDTSHADGSSSSCIFRKVDNCLLDPNLFQRVDEVTACGLGLIDYEPETFPLIEARSWDFFVNAGDLPAIGNLGQRNAVAVRRNRNGECLTVLYGHFLSDRVEKFGGIAPGFEDNKAFAESLVDFLTAHSRDKIYTSTSSDLFNELEGLLGDLIKDVLSRNAVDGDFFDLIPEAIRNKLRDQVGRIDYSLATYIHLVSILKARWPKFEPYFSGFAGKGITREEIVKPLFEINEQRTNLAHAHKTKQRNIEFGPHDVLAIRQALELVRGAKNFLVDLRGHR
jgi:hypothetical protein